MRREILKYLERNSKINLQELAGCSDQMRR